MALHEHLVPLPDQPEEDDISASFAASAKSERMDRLIREADALMKEDTTLEEKEQEAEADDPLGVRLLKGTSAFIKDSSSGLIIESIPQVVGGARDAVQNTMEAIDSLAEWLNSKVDLGGNLTFEDIGAEKGPLAASKLAEAAGKEPEEEIELNLPEIDPARSITGGIVRSFAQFFTGFLPMLRSVRLLNGGRKALSMTGQVAQIEVSGAAAAALVFDPHEDRLSNLIQQIPMLQNPVTEYLATEPGDTELDGRFKNALEGLGFGIFAEGMLRSLRAIKFNRADKGVKFDEAISLNDEVFKQKIRDGLGGDKDTGFISDEAAEAFARGDIPVEALPFQMNWAQFTSSENVADALGRTARLFAGQINKARRGVITDEALRALARKLNLSPQELLNRQAGQAFNAETMLAAKAILDASTVNVMRLSTIAKDSTDIADIFIFKKMMNIHGALQQQFQGAASEAGRALRSLQIPTGSSQKRIAELNAMLMQDGGPDQVRRIANLVDGLDDPAKLDKAIKGSFGKRAIDMVIELWYSSLLSGPQTHAVNITTSGINVLWQIAERSLAARINLLRGSTDGVVIGEAKDAIYAVVETFGDAIRAAGRTLKTGESTSILQKPERRTQRAISASNFGLDGVEGSLGRYVRRFVDGVGQFVRFPTTALIVEDEFFRVIGRGITVKTMSRRIATREGLEGRELAERMVELQNNPSRMVLEEAEDFSRRLTFTQELGTTGKGFQEATNQHPILKFIVPFIRTPINLIKFAGSRSPLALLSGDIRAAIAGGGAASDLALARITMGTGLAMVMVDMALKGRITGAGPSDPELAKTWRRTHVPFSIRIGDTWYSYNRTDPFGLIIGASASYAEVFGVHTVEENGKFIAAIALAASKSVFNKTWMRGPAEFLDAATQPDKFGERYIEQNIGSFLVPTLAAQTARVIDPVWRQVNDVSDAIRARTPGYSSSLLPMVNLWGHNILLEGGLGPDIVSPIYLYGVKPRPIDDYMFENKINVDKPSKVQWDIELSPAELTRFTKLAGNELKVDGEGAYDTLNSIIAGKHALSGRWAGGSDGSEGSRALIIRKVIESFREFAREEFISENDEVRQRRDKRIRDKQDALLGVSIGIGE